MSEKPGGGPVLVAVIVLALAGSWVVYFAWRTLPMTPPSDAGPVIATTQPQGAEPNFPEPNTPEPNAAEPNVAEPNEPNEPNEPAIRDSVTPEYLALLERQRAGEPKFARWSRSGNNLDIETKNVQRLRLDRRELGVPNRVSVALTLDGQGIEWTGRYPVIEFELAETGAWKPVRKISADELEQRDAPPAP